MISGWPAASFKNVLPGDVLGSNQVEDGPYLASDVTKLAFVWTMLPPNDKDTIRRAAERYIKPVLRSGTEMLTPIISDR